MFIHVHLWVQLESNEIHIQHPNNSQSETQTLIYTLFKTFKLALIFNTLSLALSNVSQWEVFKGSYMVPHPCKPLPKFTTSSDKNKNLLTGYPLMALQVAYMKMTGFLSRQEEPLKSYIIHIGIAIFVHLDDRYLCSKQKSTKTNKQTNSRVCYHLFNWILDWFLSDDGLKATLFWGFYRTTQSQGLHKLGFHLALLSWH